MHPDPYLLSAESTLEAPVNFRQRLKYLGPSFILSASIVGSGELIATTTLGSQAGFLTLWVIILSCLVKVAVQVEFGKHTILTGETPMKAFNQLGGPRWGKANWSVWAVLLSMTIKLLQVGGIIGGVAIILNMVMPTIDISGWAFVVAIVVALLVFRGYYRFIESFSLLMMGFFTLFTLASLYFLGFTPYALDMSDIMSGLQFSLPKEAVAIAIGAFGITGVGGDEIIYYNYWCLEKGYARHTGPYEEGAAWEARAKGWIKVMQLDAVFAMVVYTVVTIAFYLLGAAVLYAEGDIPQGFQMVETLSEMYTRSLGPWAKSFFLFGSFIVLFSTVFVALASWTRQISDIFGQIGIIDFLNVQQRLKSIAILAWIIPLLWALLFVFIKLPVLMVLIGGVVGSVLLFIVIFAVLHFRYKGLAAAFVPGVVYDLILWLSIISISFIAIYGLYQLL